MSDDPERPAAALHQCVHGLSPERLQEWRSFGAAHKHWSFTLDEKGRLWIGKAVVFLGWSPGTCPVARTGPALRVAKPCTRANRAGRHEAMLSADGRLSLKSWQRVHLGGLARAVSAKETVVGVACEPEQALYLLAEDMAEYLLFQQMRP